MCTGRTAFSNDFAVNEYRVSGQRPVMFKSGPFGPPEPGLRNLAARIEVWTMALLTVNPEDRPSAQELASDINRRIALANSAVAGD